MPVHTCCTEPSPPWFGKECNESLHVTMLVCVVMVLVFILVFEVVFMVSLQVYDAPLAQKAYLALHSSFCH